MQIWGPPRQRKQYRNPPPVPDEPAKRKYIRVPYRDRNQAKQLGAKWCPKLRSWYIPAGLGQTWASELTTRFVRVPKPSTRILQRILEAPLGPRLINPKTHSPMPLAAGDFTRERESWGMSALPVVAQKDLDGSWYSVAGDHIRRHGMKTPARSTRSKTWSPHAKPDRYARSAASTHSGAMSVDGGGPPILAEPNFIEHDDDTGVYRRNVRNVRPSQGLMTARPGFHEEPPTCPILTSTDRQVVAIWRKHLQTFENALYEYNIRNGLRYSPPLKIFVHPSTWATIGEQLLAPEDMTKMGAPINDTAVEDYLRGVHRYSNAHGKPGELYCAEPVEEYKRLTWPERPGLSYVTAFDIYIAKWRQLTTSLPEADKPEDSELVPIMQQAIKPAWLRMTIARKIAGGKGPELFGPTTRWRKRASEHLGTLVTVIRENTHAAQVLRNSPTLRQWSSPARQQTTNTVSLNSWEATPSLESVHLGPAKPDAPLLGVHGRRGPPASDDANDHTRGGGGRSNVGGGGGHNHLGGGTNHGDTGGSNPNYNLGGGVGGHQPPPAVDTDGPPLGPVCPAEGCTRRCKPRRNGGYFTTCFDHSKHGIALKKKQQETGETPRCALAGCDQPRAAKPSGGFYLTCTHEHYVKLRSPDNGRKTSTAAEGAQPPGGTNEPGSSSKKARHCFFCGEKHIVSMCPKLNGERRKELAEKVNMTEDPLWWTVLANRRKAQDYALAHQWAARKASGPPHNGSDHSAAARASSLMGPNHHGWAELVGECRSLYFDLGGEFNLVDEALFEQARRNAQLSTSRTTIISPTTFEDPRGIPIDMAASSQANSSVIWVRKWALMDLVLHTRHGRCLHLAQQRVGFVNRSTPLLLLGQAACEVCGYRTIEQQDMDRGAAANVQHTPTPAGSDSALSQRYDFHRVPTGLLIAAAEAQARLRKAYQEGTQTAEPAAPMPDAGDGNARASSRAGTPEGPQVHDAEQEPDEQWRAASPTTVLDADIIDLPGLVPMPFEGPEETSTDDNDSDGPEDWTYVPEPRHVQLPQIHTAHMQRATRSRNNALALDEHTARAVAAFAEPSKVHHYVGDLLVSESTLIVHQTNCTSRRAAGIAADIFRRFPYADCYSMRGAPSEPGTIDVRGGITFRLVVNLHGQYAPGKSTARGRDSKLRRLTYFQAGLENLAEYIENMDRSVTSVTFPARIGCGLAGGDWSDYLNCIEQFARRANRAKIVQVFVCHLHSPASATPEMVQNRNGSGTPAPDRHRPPRGHEPSRLSRSDGDGPGHHTTPDNGYSDAEEVDAMHVAITSKSTSALVDLTSGDDATEATPKYLVIDLTQADDDTVEAEELPLKDEDSDHITPLHLLQPDQPRTSRLRSRVPVVDKYAPGWSGPPAGVNTMVSRAEAGERVRAMMSPEPTHKRARTLLHKAPIKTTVKPSTIQGAGLGLFCEERVSPGDTVARYSGKVLNRAQADLSSSEYILKVSADVYIDAHDPSTWEGRYINDGPHAGRQPNCVFASAYNTNEVPESDLRWVKVFAIREIMPGEELLMSYGNGYWDAHARPPGDPGRQFRNAHADPVRHEDSLPAAIGPTGLTLNLLAAVNSQLPDAAAYVGRHAYSHVLGTDVFYCETCKESYITTAVLRRSGNHPQDPGAPPADTTPTQQPLTADSEGIDRPTWEWLCAGEPPKSNLYAGQSITVDEVVVLLPETRKLRIQKAAFKIVPGSEMRAVMGRDLWEKVEDEASLRYKARPLNAANRKSTVRLRS